MTREVCRKELAPRVDAFEREGGFPEHAFRTLGALGLLSLPYPEEFGGGGQPYEVYLQVVEEIATVWMSVAVGVSVHALTCYPVAEYGTDEQRHSFLPDMLSGDWLGGYCLSEPDSGSDVGSMATEAARADDGGGWILNGTKAWISHAAHANYYTTFARIPDLGAKGITCFLVPDGTPGLSFGKPEDKMGLHGDPVAQVVFDNVHLDPDRRAALFDALAELRGRSLRPCKSHDIVARRGKRHGDAGAETFGRSGEKQCRSADTAHCRQIQRRMLARRTICATQPTVKASVRTSGAPAR